MKYFIVFLLLFTPFASSQDEILKSEQFTVEFDTYLISAYDINKKEFFNKEFSSPTVELYDLDQDGIDEILIIDTIITSLFNEFAVYIFNTIDSFYLADSVYSGTYEPYKMYSEETGGIILITGNPEFSMYNEDILPINCWQYENSSLYSVNDVIYNIFINENDLINQDLELFFEDKGYNCNSTLEISGVLAAVYANYLNAGEYALASQYLKKYYLCEDIEQFQQKINNLLKGNSDENGLE